MPASSSVNPLTTSHKVEHLSSTFLHNRSHDKTILYFISHCLNKNTLFGTPVNKQKTFFNTAKKKLFTSGFIL